MEGRALRGLMADLFCRLVRGAVNINLNMISY